MGRAISIIKFPHLQPRLTAPLARPDRSPSPTSPSDQALSPCRNATHRRPHFPPSKVERPVSPPRGHTALQPTTEKKAREEINEKKRNWIRENQKEEAISGMEKPSRLQLDDDVCGDVVH